MSSFFRLTMTPHVGSRAGRDAPAHHAPRPNHEPISQWNAPSIMSLSAHVISMKLAPDFGLLGDACAARDAEPKAKKKPASPRPARKKPTLSVIPGGKPPGDIEKGEG